MTKWELSKRDCKGEGIELFNTFPKLVQIIFIFIVLVFILLKLIHIDVLLASDFETNEYLKSWRMSEGDSFIIVYTHSVQLTPVTETYVIENNKIKLTDTTFSSFGAGLPASTPYKFEITHEGFRIYDINQIMENLIYRTGAVRANHSLIFKEMEYKFLDFSQPREGVRLEFSKISAFKYILKEGLK